MESRVLYLQILDLRVYYLLFLCLFYMFTVISQTTLNSLLEKSKLFSNIKKKKKIYTTVSRLHKATAEAGRVDELGRQTELITTRKYKIFNFRNV